MQPEAELLSWSKDAQQPLQPLVPAAAWLGLMSAHSQRGVQYRGLFGPIRVYFSRDHKGILLVIIPTPIVRILVLGVKLLELGVIGF